MVFVAPGWSTPSTYHWYVGATPPFVGVAVNTTSEPSDTGLLDAVTAKLGVKVGLTVRLTEDETGNTCSKTKSSMAKSFPSGCRLLFIKVNWTTEFEPEFELYIYSNG